MQEKLEHLENSLQELHHELEHAKGAAINNQESLQRLMGETGQCVRGDDLEHLTNVSAAAHQEIKSFHDKMSGVISLAQQDECSEGSLPCGEIGLCTNTLFSFTCSCPSGFTWDGSECADIDECAEGKGVCSSNAICKNSIGSYSCSCDKPFEGDGITSCEFQCRYPAKTIKGLGCIKVVTEVKSFREMDAFCQEEGGRLLQNFNKEHLSDIGKTFDYYGWVGVYEEKWTSDEALVPRVLWVKGFPSNPSLRCCGYLVWEDSSSSRKVTQMDCSEKRYGFCQFQLP